MRPKTADISCRRHYRDFASSSSDVVSSLRTKSIELRTPVNGGEFAMEGATPDSQIGCFRCGLLVTGDRRHEGHAVEPVKFSTHDQRNDKPTVTFPAAAYTAV